MNEDEKKARELLKQLHNAADALFDGKRMSESEKWREYHAAMEAAEKFLANSFEVGAPFKVREAKEYPWGVFTLWVFPEDALHLDADGRLSFQIESRDDVARNHGQRSRRELYWSNTFRVIVPREDLIAN